MKTYGLAVVVIFLLLVTASPALAQAPGTTSYTVYGAAIGAGLVILGAGWGFGRIGASALEGMARQPEATGKNQPAMILSAALREGATFFELLTCMIKKR